jgi:Legionella pneumophila major outer membrane protein precursor
MRSILFSVLVFACGSVSASFYGGGDVLYWQPGSRSFDYALLSTGTVRTICPDYSWGGRLYGGYRCDCLRFELSGLWIDGSDSAEVRGENITLPFCTGSGIEQANGKLQTSYWNLDGRAGFAFHRDCLLSFELLGGARFASIQQRREVAGLTEQEDQIFSKDRIEFCGAGPEVGVRVDAQVLCDFYLTGELDLIALIGERKQTWSTSEGPGVHFRDETAVVPAVDLRLALGYGRQFGCWELAAELGYQMNYFFQPVTPLVEFAQTVSVSVPVTRHEQDMSFGGPFIGIRVGF